MTSGAFVRQQSRFRGRPHGGPERHHLYVALACPWSQRAVIVRAVLGVEIGISYAAPVPRRARLGVHRRALHRRGQRLRLPRAGLPRDRPRLRRPRQRPRPVGQGGPRDRLQRVGRHRPHLQRVGRRRPLPGRPARGDRRAQRVDLLRAPERRLPRRASPAHRRPTRRRSAACSARSSGSRRTSTDRTYLLGDAITEADWRLLPTLLRFDAVYHTHFRCNGKRLIEYPNLIRYATDLYASRTSPRRSRSTRSSATTTRPTTSSTRSGSSPPGRSTSASPTA